MGEADEHSDVDFLVLTNSEVTAEQERALQEMHADLHELETPWAQHLEGSYAPKDRFRRVDVERTPLLFLITARRGSCGTAIATRLSSGGSFASAESRCSAHRHKRRSTLSPRKIYQESASSPAEYIEWAPEPTRLGRMSRWKQPYLVLTLCRILNTIETGRVASKRDAAEWARGNLDARWRPLIDRAVADRPDPWARTRQQADDGLIDETLAFAEYAMRREGV